MINRFNKLKFVSKLLVGIAAVTMTAKAEATCTASPNGTVINTVGYSLCDASGNSWAITSTGTVTENGAHAGASSGVIEIAYVGGLVYAENFGLNWYSWTSGNFNLTGTTSPVPVGCSPNNTAVTVGTTVCDSASNVWAITTTGTVTENGVHAGASANVMELVFAGGSIWAMNTSLNWYMWGNNAGFNQITSVTSPVLPGNSPNNTIVGSVGPTLYDRSNNAFAISSTGTVTENGAHAGSSSGVIEIAYAGGLIWAKNTAGNWYSWINGNFGLVGTTSPAPQCTTSGNDATVASVGPTLCDSAHNVWAISSTGTATINGVNAANSSSIIEIAYVNGILWSENSGTWWAYWQGSTSSWQGATATSPLTQTGLGYFSVSGGKIIDPNGTLFIARGFNLAIELANSSDVTVAQIQTLFPRTNYVRITNFLGATSTLNTGYGTSGPPWGGYPDAITPQSISAWVTTLTNKGIVVQFSDYASNSGVNSSTCRQGGDLTAAAAWYSAAATYYASNPYVWFEAQNECFDYGGGSISQNEIQVNYNAVRAASPHAMFLIGSAGGSISQANGAWYFSNTLFAPMTNIAFDIHPYAGNFTGASIAANQSAYDSYLTSVILSYSVWHTTSESAVPVISGELGNSTDGSNVDATGPLANQAAGDTATGNVATGSSGAAYWEWNCNCGPIAADTLVSTWGGPPYALVSPMGTQVQSIIAGMAGTGPTPLAANDFMKSGTSYAGTGHSDVLKAIAAGDIVNFSAQSSYKAFVASRLSNGASKMVNGRSALATFSDKVTKPIMVGFSDLKMTISSMF